MFKLDIPWGEVVGYGEGAPAHTWPAPVGVYTSFSLSRRSQRRLSSTQLVFPAAPRKRDDYIEEIM